MLKDTDAALYYRRREEQERALAADATDAQVRKIHLELADGYAARVQDPGQTSRSRSHLQAVPNQLA
jgi:hypothetical protein